MALWMLFGVLLSAAAVAACNRVIGSNPITCITFDKRAYGSFQATNWVYIKARGVSVDPDGVDKKAGRFSSPSHIKIPLFWGNDFFQLSVSMWFTKRADLSGACMILLSTGQCELSPIMISSAGDTYLKVRVKTSVSEYIRLVQTDSQTGTYNHVVVTFGANPGTLAGNVRIYVNGVMQSDIQTKGRIERLPGAMLVGSDRCGGDTDFIGSMDSVSFARTTLSASDTKLLYNSRGRCIGE